ncbi:MAG: hypothetical protein ACXWE6_10280 [Nitrososphaeraceae archaeon]
MVFLVLFCLFIRIHIIEPRGPAQGGITKGIIPTNEPDNEII